VLRTVPGIALLAFMLPWLGIGVMPSIAALFLYSLYPIARNTVTGLREADHAAVLSPCAGHDRSRVLRYVQYHWRHRSSWPASAPPSGDRHGHARCIRGRRRPRDPIVAGPPSRYADGLSGAIPAALMALAVDGVLAAVERRATPVAMRARGRPAIATTGEAHVRQPEAAPRLSPPRQIALPAQLPMSLPLSPRCSTRSVNGRRHRTSPAARRRVEHARRPAIGRPGISMLRSSAPRVRRGCRHQVR
jgi:osmoprotectant transport system permease protein